MSRSNLATILILSWIISFHTCLAYGKDNNTLLFFTAPWCKFCQVAKNDINTHKNLSEIVKKYDIVFLDFDVDKEFVEGYNIKTIPTFIVINNGKETKRQVGYPGGSNGLYNFLK